MPWVLSCEHRIALHGVGSAKIGQRSSCDGMNRLTSRVRWRLDLRVQMTIDSMATNEDSDISVVMYVDARGFWAQDVWKSMDM